MFVTPGYAQDAAPAEGQAHTEGAAHTEAGGEHAGGFPPFNPQYFASQLLWLAITFGLFYLFLQKVILPRLAGILDVRADRIGQDLHQATRMKDEADAAVAAYEQELAEARKNANAIAQMARDEARADAEAERKRVEAELDAKLEAAQVRISSIKTSAMGEVGSIAEETASAIVSELVGGSVDNAEVAAAVRDAGR